MNHVKSLVTASILLVAWSSANAQRSYIFRLDTNAEAAASTNPPAPGTGDFFGEGYVSSYAIHPTVSMFSRSGRSTTSLSYSFRLEDFGSDLDLNGQSHSVAGSVTTDLSPRLLLKISERFTRSPEFSSFARSRGDLSGSEGQFLDFETVAVQRSGFFNTAEANVLYKMDPRSELSFGLSHGARKFDAAEGFNDSRLDTVVGGSVFYSRKLSERSSWNIDYDARNFRVTSRPSFLTQSVSVGLSHQFPLALDLELSFGGAHTDPSGSEPGFYGAVGSLGISRPVGNSRFSVSFGQANGVNDGTGIASRSRWLGMLFSRPLGRRVEIEVALKTWNSRQLQSINPQVRRGVDALLLFSFPISENSSIEVGGRYLDRNENRFSTQPVDETRFFVSWRFSVPDIRSLWR